MIQCLKKQILIILSISFILLLFFCCNDKDETCDSDNDGCIDIFDDFPENADYYRDTDGDGISDETDLDIDGDGMIDNIDAVAELFPDSSESFWESLVNDSNGANQIQSCINDLDGDGCNDLFDHYPYDPEKDTNYELGDNIPSCDERMNDCKQTYPLYLNTNYE